LLPVIAQIVTMTIQVSEQQICRATRLQCARLVAMQRKNSLKIVALSREAGKCGDGAVMRCQRRMADRPAGDVRLTMRQHGRAPDVTQAAQRE
jgi:hypothetical protein